MSIKDVIPETWRSRKLWQVAKVIMGQAPLGETYNTKDVGVPLIAGASDLGDVFPKPQRWTTSPTQLCEPGDIIYCVRATIGEMNWADKQYCLGRGVAAIQSDEQFIVPEYLYYWLLATKESFIKLGSGSTFIQIRRQDIEEFPIPVPPKPEQRRIVSILRQADQLLQLRREAAEKAQQLLPTLFDEMFGGVLAEKNGWKHRKLSLLGEIQYGLTLNSGRERNPLKYPYLRVANVLRWELNLSNVATVGITRNEVEKYQLLDGDVLVVEGHADPNQIGRAAVWQSELPVCLHQNHLLRIRTYETEITPNYIAGYINSSLGREYMRRHAKTVVDSIRSTLQSYLICLFYILLTNFNGSLKGAMQPISKSSFQVSNLTGKPIYCFDLSSRKPSAEN